MQVKNNPKLIIVLVVVVFGALLAVALYSPAYVTGSSQNSHSLTIIPVSIIHPNNLSANSNAIASENYTGVFYVQHICTYHQ